MNLLKLRTNQKGFTLVELLVVIGILAVLLAIVLIAVNPARHFAEANNSKRRSDVSAILNAVHQYMVANNGTPPAGITTTDKTITGTVGATNIDLCTALGTYQNYIADLPLDPQTGTDGTPSTPACDGNDYDTQYTIRNSATGNRITVSAPDAQLGQTISVTR
ncbi:MAG TPA: type II secretion system protein [Candidatus Saccharimonadales bacterium]|nr:type II secretion system protein [Candidatus Saccharimonadales bacterium]